MDTASYRSRLLESLLDELLRELPALMLIGPRAAGKTTTIARRAATVVRLDVAGEAVAFRADPDAALRGLDEPVLLDEWQEVPEVLGAVRRAVDRDPSPNRFYLTGSALAERSNDVWPGTGRLVRLPLFPMAERELRGGIGARAFFDRIVGGEVLAVPGDTPDLRGYVDLALRSGFPHPALHLAGRARQAWLDSYVGDLLTHDVERIEEPRTRGRDPVRLRRFFEAYALNSAGVVDLKTIYDAAQVNKRTATAYEDLLADLCVVDQIPAWASNRLQRLVHQPKRCLVDPGLLAAALRVDATGIVRDGGLLGRVLETFVIAQLRPEVVVSRSRPRLHHVRTAQGRHEIDLLVELGGQQLIAIEVTASAAPGADDARHLAWLREAVGARFAAGIVFHTGPRVYELGRKIVAAPISTIWG